MKISEIPKVSIAVATYEMGGLGRKYLAELLQSVASQSYKRIEIIVSDESSDDDVVDECNLWQDRLDIAVVRQTNRISASANFNRALVRCSGDIIKVLCQDDFLFSTKAIDMTVGALSYGNSWLVSAVQIVDENRVLLGIHTPVVAKRPHLKNLIGSHSCLSFINNDQIEMFDENLLWRMDCDLFTRLLNRFGDPYILTTPSVSVRQWSGQATNTQVSMLMRVKEYLTMVQRYGF